jgi:3-isopropylmalate/(R)-2-methylmalate dehydratase large subunit
MSRSRTFAQKVLEQKSGESDLQPGDIVDAFPDLYMSHVASWRCIKTLEKMPGRELYAPDRIAMVMDHLSPAQTSKTAASHKLCREFAVTHGIKKFWDVDAGIAHLVLMERGHIRPGMLIIGTDSHSTIYGALGAFGTGVGFSEITATWVTGKLWMKVPESIRIVVDGPLQPGVYPKDVMLRLVGLLGADGGTYCSLEFHGTWAESLSISERSTLCNLSMEMGAKNAVVPADAVTRAYLEELGVGAEQYEPLLPDPDATYRETVELDGRELVPQIACPHSVDNVHPIDEVAGTKLDQVFIGSCANAKYDDLAEAAAILKGHTIDPSVRMIITPGSKQIQTRAINDGIITTLLDAGALMTNPGCGACAGDGGVMADGERTLSTANRNFRGRMGSYEAEIFLASPATAAASAITGRITDPREFIGAGDSVGAAS